MRSLLLMCIDMLRPSQDSFTYINESSSLSSSCPTLVERPQTIAIRTRKQRLLHNKMVVFPACEIVLLGLLSSFGIAKGKPDYFFRATKRLYSGFVE